jgi:hypothetical protein
MGNRPGSARRRFAQMNADWNGDAKARRKSLKHRGKEEAEERGEGIANVRRKAFSPQICADERRWEQNLPRRHGEKEEAEERGEGIANIRRKTFSPQICADCRLRKK